MTKDKDELYSRLLTIIQDHPERNIIIVIEDFNTKIGNDGGGYEEIISLQGLGEMNDNRKRFSGLCATSNLVKGGSVFQHRRIHKATRISSDLQTENQINHMCIGKRFRRTLQDVGVKRGADLASDLHLLAARLMLKLKRNCTGRTNQRLGYHTLLLNDTNKREEFSITLSNKFQVLQKLMEEETFDVKWQRVKGVVTSICNEVLGPRNPNHKGWISTETLNKTEERKVKKAAVNNRRTRTTKAQEEYKGVNWSVERSLKADKRSYLESLAAEAEEAAYHRNMRDLYATIRSLSGKYSRP